VRRREADTSFTIDGRLAGTPRGGTDGTDERFDPRHSGPRAAGGASDMRMPTAPNVLTRSIPGPVHGTRITEAYARMVARDAYFWAWPMVNVYNKRLAFSRAPAPGLMNSVLPVAPLNRLAMLTDYVDPAARYVACPNQDVVYGGGVLALDQSPVVIQVPDFGDRFWVYQIVDLRTDSFAELGAMYGTRPGFYMLAGPDWSGPPIAGVTVFRARTRTGFVGPRVFQDDTAEDRQAIQPVLELIDMYPLAAYDGRMKRQNWQKLPHFYDADGTGSKTETQWVFPDTFFDQLPRILDDAPPLPGEEARYAELRAVLAAARRDRRLLAAMIDEAKATEQELIDPLQQFRNYGIPLPYYWTTVNNGAAFGTDYFTRTAIATSNILVNKRGETKYFYQDLDATGARLNGRQRYTVSFASGSLPPVQGFWSLTLYDAFHFFSPNSIERYSIGTKNKDLMLNSDGSLTIWVQPETPAHPVERSNWLPSPLADDFSLLIRAYWPDEPITSGQWTPPAVMPVD
jgi:hypothetical protein